VHKQVHWLVYPNVNVFTGSLRLVAR
jgi:hypothetical protein